MRVEVVRRPGAVLDLPYLGRAGLHDLVDATHVHLLSVDFALAGQCEPPFSHGRGRVLSREADQLRREPGGWGQVARGAKLEEVEAVVSAAEALFEEARAEIRLEASQHDRLAGVNVATISARSPDGSWIRLSRAGAARRPASLATS
jgi:hypothetical protein